MDKEQKMIINVSIELTEELISSVTKAVIEALNSSDVKESVVDFRNPIAANAHKGHGNLPDVLTAGQIADYLSVSRQAVYELLQINPEYGGIPNFAIGKSKRVEKRDFIKWIESQKSERTKRFKKR